MKARVSKKIRINSFINKEVRLDFEKPFTGQVVIFVSDDSGLPAHIHVDVNGTEIL